MKKTTAIKLKGKKIVIVTHEATTGPPHDLRDFLLNKTEEILFVAHPLLFIPSKYKSSSHWEYYKDGKKYKEGKAFHWVFPELVLYFKDLLYSFFWSLKIGKIDYYFGVGNLNTLAGILLKKIGRVDKVIFYSIDYVPERFSSKFINNVYHRIDKFAVEECDYTWNLSLRMSQGREDRWKEKLGNQVTVPIGIWYERISKNVSDKKNIHEIIYLGTLLEKQGIDICIEAVNVIRNKIKDINFTIIGSGPFENQLKKMVNKYKLEKYVKFLGYLPNHHDVEKRLSEASLAVALYNPNKDFFSYYADPGKVKSYLACGLPVIITDIPYVAKLVNDVKCGIIVKYNLEDIQSKIELFLMDEKKINIYRKNALTFAKRYDWNLIFGKAFQEII